MTRPWDRPPLPAEGDTNPDHTYSGVGRVMSQWEAVEIQLGYLYTAFVSRHGEWDALLEYGRGSTSKGRFTVLEGAAARLFVAKPHQPLEAEFDRLAEETKGFADRRHDVAHGIVRSQQWAHWWVPGEPRAVSRTKGRFFLLPSHYKGSRFDEIALPTYAYTAPLMHELVLALRLFEDRVHAFSATIRRHADGAP